MQVKYSRNVQSVAMSKSPKQSGLDLEYDSHDKVVTVQSINPKLNDITSWLRMEIPIENLQDVIHALIQIRRENE